MRRNPVNGEAAMAAVGRRRFPINGEAVLKGLKGCQRKGVFLRKTKSSTTRRSANRKLGNSQDAPLKSDWRCLSPKMVRDRPAWWRGEPGNAGGASGRGRFGRLGQ